MIGDMKIFTSIFLLCSAVIHAEMQVYPQHSTFTDAKKPEAIMWCGGFGHAEILGGFSYTTTAGKLAPEGTTVSVHVGGP